THSPSPPSPLRVSVAGVRCDSAQDRIIGVALLGAAIECLAIEGTERHVEVKPGHKVRVADEGFAERDEFGAPLRDGLVGPPSVETVTGDEEAAEEPLDRGRRELERKVGDEGGERDGGCRGDSEASSWAACARATHEYQGAERPDLVGGRATSRASSRCSVRPRRASSEGILRGGP